jgi:hypothetical protein
MKPKEVLEAMSVWSVLALETEMPLSAQRCRVPVAREPLRYRGFARAETISGVPSREVFLHSKPLLVPAC